MQSSSLSAPCQKEQLSQLDSVATKEAIGMCPRFYSPGLILDFCSVLKRVKNEFRFEVMLHTGLVEWELAESLAEAGVDAVMTDVIESDETIG